MGMRPRKKLPQNLRTLATSDEVRRMLLEEDRRTEREQPSEGYRDSVFVALTTTTFGFSDEEALAIISAHLVLLASYERRRFDPQAAARAVLEYS